MTKEEIEKMAEEYANKSAQYEYGNKSVQHPHIKFNAFLAGANSRQPEIDELKEESNTYFELYNEKRIEIDELKKAYDQLKEDYNILEYKYAECAMNHFNDLTKETL